jgi:hypothetical protein
MQVERDSPSGDESGARVRNAYATCLVQGDSPWKRGLIPHRIVESHGLTIKTTVVQDGHA